MSSLLFMLNLSQLLHILLLQRSLKLQLMSIEFIFVMLSRQNGVLEIKEFATHIPGMQDMIVATLIGMLEWRKHNNKVWIILLAAMPA